MAEGTSLYTRGTMMAELMELILGYPLAPANASALSPASRAVLKPLVCRIPASSVKR